MVYIKRTPHKYNPHKLPKALDFHLATKDLPLPDAVKTRLQVAFSKMDYKKIKTIIEYLDDMRYTALNKENYKMAAYCKSVKEFAEKYFYSIKKQKLI